MVITQIQQKTRIIVVNQKESVPAEYRRKIHQEVYYCKRFGIEAHMCHESIPGTKEQYILKLLGKVNYVLSVSPGELEFTKYQDWLASNHSNVGLLITE